METTALVNPALTESGNKRKKRIKWTPYLFILPHLIFFAGFLAYPFFNGLYISLFRYDYLQTSSNVFVGLQNYIDLFTRGTVEFQEFWNSLWNTIQFVVYSVPLLVVIPLLLALLLNVKIPGRNIFRTVYFAPWVLSVSIVGLLWFWIFQSQGGLLNDYLVAWHLQPLQWLSTQPWAWVSIVVATVWWTLGFNMVIFLAALQNIPTELYEAARVDGSNGWQSFWSVTLPMLRPMMLFVITISIIASFNLFGQPFIMTGGGPPLASGGGSTEPVMLEIYQESFVRHFAGSGAAMSFVVAIIMMAVSYANFKLFRRRV